VLKVGAWMRVIETLGAFPLFYGTAGAADRRFEQIFGKE